MIVVVVQNAPSGLRGHIARWLTEIASGVYVGNLSARVRERLWSVIAEGIGTGSATMVWSTRNEQGLDFLVLGNPWMPEDYEGLKLIFRPNFSEGNYAARQFGAGKNNEEWNESVKGERGGGKEGSRRRGQSNFQRYRGAWGK